MLKSFYWQPVILVKKYKGELDLYVTNNRLNEASFRKRLDLISKSIMRNKNPIELLFKDVKHFDTQNLYLVL